MIELFDNEVNMEIIYKKEPLIVGQNNKIENVAVQTTVHVPSTVTEHAYF